MPIVARVGRQQFSELTGNVHVTISQRRRLQQARQRLVENSREGRVYGPAPLRGLQAGEAHKAEIFRQVVDVKVWPLSAIARVHFALDQPSFPHTSHRERPGSLGTLESLGRVCGRFEWAILSPALRSSCPLQSVEVDRLFPKLQRSVITALNRIWQGFLVAALGTGETSAQATGEAKLRFDIEAVLAPVENPNIAPQSGRKLQSYFLNLRFGHS